MKSIRLLSPLLVAAGLLAPSPCPAVENVAVGGYAGPKATLLSIDNESLPFRDSLCYYMTKPKVRKEPVLSPTVGNRHAPDASSTHFYGTVLHEGDKFRMWYYAVGWKDNPDHKADEKSVLHEGPVCYAESPDGIHWTKPNLGQVEFNGSRENNAIALPAPETEGAFLIRDDNDPDSSRRYKMIYENTSAKRPTADTAVSADGITWKDAGRAARLLEPSAFYKFNGLYTISAQNLGYVGEGGHRAGRQGFVWVSSDFVHWLPGAGESFLLPEPNDPNTRGHDRKYVQVHLGVGPASFGNIMVGLYCQWHAEPNPGDWFGQGTTFGDFGLVLSNDGQHFREPVKGYVFLNRHHSRPPGLSPEIRTEEVLTQSGNGILNVGDETRIYHGRWMNTEKLEDYYAEIALATIPRDRWGALGLVPHAAEGAVWTAPLTLGRAGAKVSVNAAGAQGLRLEITDENFQPIAEFSGDNSGTVAADGLDSAVGWSKGSLDSLVGRRVRMVIHLKKSKEADPRFFAAYITGP